MVDAIKNLKNYHEKELCITPKRNRLTIPISETQNDSCYIDSYS